MEMLSIERRIDGCVSSFLLPPSCTTLVCRDTSLCPTRLGHAARFLSADVHAVDLLHASSAGHRIASLLQRVSVRVEVPARRGRCRH